MIKDKLEKRLFERLSPETREFLRDNKILIPVIIALGPKFAKNVRPEHLKYLLDHKEMIRLVVEAGGTSAWVMLEGFSKLQKPYVGPIL